MITANSSWRELVGRLMIEEDGRESDDMQQPGDAPQARHWVGGLVGQVVYEWVEV
jgi:hypothetical protein